MIAGIDIGTSYSSICILNKDGKAEAIKTSTGLGMYGNDYSLPSAVFVDKDKVLVGQAAYNSRMKAPENFKNEFKRDFGQNIPYHLGNQSFLPEDLYKELFVHMKTCAETYSGEKLEHAYITHPARFSDDQKKRLKQAANRGGLLNVTLVEEPVAAAFHYVAENNLEDDKTLLIYDFGGGTFDVALIRFRHGKFEIMTAPTGIERCGGIDVDKLIYDDILQTIPSELKESVNVNSKLLQNFKSQISEYSIKAKHHLSSSEVFHNEFQVFYDFVDYRLERTGLNQLIFPIIKETVNCVRALIEKASIKANDIDALLLVGGSSRIPLVKEVLTGLLHKPVKENINPELAIALGAAAWGKSQNLSCGYIAGKDTIGKWGFLDFNKNPVVPFIYEEAKAFSENRAAVKMNGKWGVIDQTGKIVTPFDYDEIFSYNQGLAKARKENKYGFLNHSGKEHTAFKYTELGEFTDNLCPAKIGNLYGYISPDGCETIPVIYSYVAPFVNGKAPVKRNNKVGYINSEGKEFIPCVFDKIEDFNSNRAIVKIDNRFGFIFEDGKAATRMIYHSITRLENEHSIVNINEKQGVIDSNDNIIVPIQFKKVIYDPNDKQYIVEEKNQKGIYSFNGEIIKPIEIVKIIELTRSNYNSDLVEMVFVEGGTYMMNKSYKVTLSDFYISKHLITQKQWKEIMRNNPCKLTKDNNPVESISWYEAIVFCNKLSELEGFDQIYSVNGNTVILNTNVRGYRLPTEAEWEFAARGGNKSNGFIYAGSNNVDEVAWYRENNQGRIHPIGQKRPNELGLFDMSGNVSEWCQDWYSKYPDAPQVDPVGPISGSFRVDRGGSWNIDAANCSTNSRSFSSPSNRNISLGFRIVLSLV